MFYFIIIHLLASLLFYAPFVGDGVLTAYTASLSHHKNIHTIQVIRRVTSLDATVCPASPFMFLEAAPVDLVATAANNDVEISAQKVIDAIATSSSAFVALDLTAFGMDTNPTIITTPLAGVHATAPARSVESEIRAFYALFDMSLIRGAGAKAYVRYVLAVNATAAVDVAPVPAHPIYHSLLPVGQAFGPVTAASFTVNATRSTVNVQVAARQSSLKKASAPIETVTGSVAHVGKPFVRTITNFLPVGQSFGPVSFTSFHANVSHFTVDTAPFQPTIETPLKARTIHHWAVCGTDMSELEVCLVDPLSVRELSVIDDDASNTERVSYHIGWDVAIMVAFGVLVQTIGVVLFHHLLSLVATTTAYTTDIASTGPPIELADSTIAESVPSSPATSTDATTFVSSDAEANLPVASSTADSSLPPPSTKSVAELNTVATTKRNPATACAPYVKSGRRHPKRAKKATKTRTVKQGASATRRAHRAAQGSNDVRTLLIHADDSCDHPLITVGVPSARWVDRLTRPQQSHFVASAFQLLKLADVSRQGSGHPSGGLPAVSA